MLIGRERFEEVYNTIKQGACVGGACTVLILVAPDCDAVCACHILTRLLRDDNIPFKVTPVSGYGDVAAATSDASDEYSETRSVIMLNCGATVNLEQVFGASAATVFVVDSHRPLHLRNVHSGGKVVVLDAEAMDAGDAPSDGEDLDEDFPESDDDEEDLSESEEEEEEEEEEESDGDGDGEDGEDDAGSRSRKRSSRSRRRDEKRAKKESADAASSRRRAVRAYYDGTYDGPPTSALLFALSEGVTRAESTELWLAALGLTFARAQFRITDEAYDDFSHYFAAQLRHVDARRGPGGATDAPRKEAGAGWQAPPGTVTFEREELRFMLHRHWPLFDAMYYSNYVASRLSVWKADGKRKLQELLAKIGLSLEACRQKYAFLSDAQREAMKVRLKDQGPNYDLDDPFTTSFHRVGGSGDVVSAQDAASIVEALLEGHFLEDNENAPPPPPRDAAPGPNGATEESASLAQRRSDLDRKRFLRGFWRAYDACLPDDERLLQQGIHAATLLQRGVVQQAVSMVEKKEITTLKHFRYAYITSAGASDVFAKPLAVRKLALFLLGVHQNNGKWTNDRDKPLVILAERHDTFLVVGVAKHEGTKKNRLSHAFKLAAEHIKADFKHDWFDAAVIEVLHDDVQRFVESLHYIMAQVS